MVRSFILWLAKGALLLATVTGCVRIEKSSLCQDIVTQPAQIAHLETLWSPPIDPLISAPAPWQIEAHLGDQLARKLRWQEALWCYKRAELLAPTRTAFASQVLGYNTFLCHYLANQPQMAIQAFEIGALVDIPPTFSAYRDLLVALGDCYAHLSLKDRMWETKKDHVQRLLLNVDSTLANTLFLRQMVQSGNSDALTALGRANKELSHLQPLMKSFKSGVKSAKKAALFNALLPGAGYWYVGLKQTAVTSFALNALFGAAAWRFFRKGDTAAGLIALSFEAGWYFGGIQGAHLAAGTFNQRRFQPFGNKILREHGANKAALIRRGF